MYIYLFPIISASVIVAVSFGGRQILPLTIDDIITSTSLDYLTLSFAFAIGQVMWGFANYIGGIIADKFGNEKALILGILLSAFGCSVIPYCETPIEIILAVGLLSAGGSGIAGLAVAMSAVNKKVPPEKSGMAFGILNAGGSLGQTFLAPIGVILIVNYGWTIALNALTALLICTLPFAYMLKDSDPRVGPTGKNGTVNIRRMIKIAFATPS